MTQRHAGSGCLGSFDGHVEWLNRKNFLVQSQLAPGRFWCNPDTTDGHPSL